jgi:uncharacterized protein (TIGR03437 family)
MIASFGGSGIHYNFPGSHGSAIDTVTEVALDRAGNIHLVGTAYSTDFPQVQGLQSGPVTECTFNCGFRSLFAARLSPDGRSIRYRTFVSAPSSFLSTYGPPPLLPSALAVDADGTAYIGGATTGENFPGADGTVKPVMTAGSRDAFLLKLDPNGRVLASMLIGGKDDDAFTSMALGSDGFLYLAGTTKSVDFPVTSGAYRTTHSGGSHVFVTKVKPPQNTVVFTTLLGQAADQIVSVAEPVIRVDAAGSVHVAVSTASRTWPTTPGALQPQCAGSGCRDVVLAKLSAAGDRLLYCTYFGGTGEESAGGLAIDGTGNAYIAGSTSSLDLPVTGGALQERWTPSEPRAVSAFVTKINADATRLEYSTYLHGSRRDEAHDIMVDAQGVAYVGGGTTSQDFPSRNAVQAGLHNGMCAQYTPSGSIPTGVYFCGSSGFLTAVNPEGNGVVWSTHIGRGSVFALALDSGQRVYMGGESLDFMHLGRGAASVVRFDPARTSVQFAPNAIVNAASFHPGLPHPGGLASVFLQGLDLTGSIVSGPPPLPVELAGVSIAVDGTDAPILAVADLGGGRQQINFQVPFEAKSNRVEVRYRGLSTFAIPETVGPGIFTLPSGEGAIQQADYKLVTASNPAKAGEVILVYATGFGPVKPAVVTGAAAAGPAVLDSNCYPRPTLQASLGTVEYAGIAPGHTGVYQLNVRLPETLPPGSGEFSVYWTDCWPLGRPPGNYVGSNVVPLHVE